MGTSTSWPDISAAEEFPKFRARTVFPISLLENFTPGAFTVKITVLSERLFSSTFPQLLSLSLTTVSY